MGPREGHCSHSEQGQAHPCPAQIPAVQLSKSPKPGDSVSLTSHTGLQVDKYHMTIPGAAVAGGGQQGALKTGVIHSPAVLEDRVQNQSVGGAVLGEGLSWSPCVAVIGAHSQANS